MTVRNAYGGSDVAVIVAVRDGEQYLTDAIDSILGQTAPAAEVVVVDDGSRDGTAAILRSYGEKLRVIRQPATGQYAAMNRAIRVTSSAVLAFLDADDLFTPSSLEVRLDRLGGFDGPDAVFGRIEQFVSPDLEPHEAARIRYDATPQRVELFQAMLIRRASFARVGPLDESLRTSSNLDWISRARAIGIASVEVDAVVGRRRLHRTNLGRTAKSERNRDLLHVVRAHRRRAPDADDARER